VLAILQRNVQRAQEIIARAVPNVTTMRNCACSNALRSALITDPALIPTAARERLGLLINRYLP
jgi:5'-methylthioadenosine phosphorylase